MFQRFIQSITTLVGKSDSRTPTLSPNQVAIALWVKVDDIIVLLGSDLDRLGWNDILSSTERPTHNASAFKVEHHGSKSGHHLGVWRQLLDKHPYAVLTPWSRGGRILPNHSDVERILTLTPNAYSTARISSIRDGEEHRGNFVSRMIRTSNINVQKVKLLPDAIRLQSPFRSGSQWNIERIGSACHLSDFAN